MVQYTYRDPEPEIWRFKEECRKQLCYFSNVYFDNCDVNNEYKIYEGEHWRYSTMDKPFSGLHMCIGSVAYPIDWDNLPIDEIDFPVALKFGIGDVDIIQTREDVKYTPKTKDAILAKIKELRKEFKTLWEKQDFEVDDLKEYLTDYSKRTSKYVVNENISFYLDKLIPTSNLKSFVFKPFKDFPPEFKLPSYPLFEYKIERKVTDDGRLRKCTAYGNDMILTIDEKTVYRTGPGKTAPKKNRYIAEEIEGGEFYFIKPDKEEVNLKIYKQKLNLHKIKKRKWRKIILTYQATMKKYIEDNTESYKDITVDKAWLESLKPRVSNKLAAGKILTKRLNYQRLRSNSYGKELCYKREEIELKDIKNKCIVIEESSDDQEKLKALSSTLATSFLKINWDDIKRYNKPEYKEVYQNNLRVYTTAKTNVKHFQNIKNIWTVEQIMSKECKPFLKTMSLIHLQQIDGVYEKYFDRDRYDAKDWRQIYTPLGDALERLYQLEYQYTTTELWWLKRNAYPVALEKGLFDYDLIKDAEFIDNYFKELDLIQKLDTGVKFPVTDIAKYIYNHNKAVKNPKRFKKINIHFYVNFNEEEKRWLEPNKEETEFINFKTEEVA
jgi:hypothetical protein